MNETEMKRMCSQWLLHKHSFKQQLKLFHPPRRRLLHKPVVFANGVATRLHNTFMLIGYARVSKIDQQDTRAQVKALKEAGCKRIFEESASGGRWDRPELHRALDQLREGDILVVWKLDRLLRKIEFWHQGSIASHKITYRDEHGAWHAVRWYGQRASFLMKPDTSASPWI
jgi:resolvase-like protein